MKGERGSGCFSWFLWWWFSVFAFHPLNVNTGYLFFFSEFSVLLPQLGPQSVELSFPKKLSINIKV